MVVVADVPAGVEAAEVFDPTVAAFDRASVSTFGVAALFAVAGVAAAADHRCDPASGEAGDVGLFVIATIGSHLTGWPGQLVDQWQEV